ncbi:unnamed protein product [Rhizophagus irregularis]|nr:unnamed protein product [Rhizophagus irregularis]CAB5384823.1 unnamed protein product [Rhizophagus irregularis]
MEFPKYNGNIHPDEWIKDIQKFYYIWKTTYKEFLEIAISLVDPTIKLPTEIRDIEELRNALKEDISFTIFKNTNKRILQALKYITERKGGNTSNFISNFRKLCYNSEINDVEEQKKYLFNSLPINHLYYIQSEFHNKIKNVNSNNELIKKFEDIVVDEANLITNESVVALKHVATGKYLSSIKNVCYETGSKSQLVFVGSSEPDPNSLWKILLNEELATYNKTSIKLQHVKSNMFLATSFANLFNGITLLYNYYESPSTKHTEVNCCEYGNSWNFKRSKLENHQGYLKSNDIINISIKKLLKLFNKNDKSGNNEQIEFLRSHDIQFTIGNDTFQEVVIHNERLGGNDEWCVELIKQA